MLSATKTARKPAGQKIRTTDCPMSGRRLLLLLLLLPDVSTLFLLLGCRRIRLRVMQLGVSPERPFWLGTSRVGTRFTSYKVAPALICIPIRWLASKPIYLGQAAGSSRKALRITAKLGRQILSSFSFACFVRLLLQPASPCRHTQRSLSERICLPATKTALNELGGSRAKQG